MVFPFALLPSNAERGAELLLGQLPQMGVNFRLAGGAKGASSCQTGKVELVLPFSHSRQKFQHRPAAHYLVVPSSSGFKSCIVVAVFLAYSKEVRPFDRWGSTRFRNRRALQPRVLGFLNRVDSSVSASNY